MVFRSDVTPLEMNRSSGVTSMPARNVWLSQPAMAWVSCGLPRGLRHVKNERQQRKPLKGD